MDECIDLRAKEQSERVGYKTMVALGNLGMAETIVYEASQTTEFNKSEETKLGWINYQE